MVGVVAANPEEVSRKEHIEPNKRKFEELGISNTAQTLSESDLTRSQIKSQSRRFKPKPIARNSLFDSKISKPRRTSKQRKPVGSHRHEELGISNTGKALSKPHLTTSPIKSQKRESRPKPIAKNSTFESKPRRSSRPPKPKPKPIESYLDDEVGIDLPTLKKDSRSTPSPSSAPPRIASSEEKSAALKAAEALKESLPFPDRCFVKQMLPSQVCRGFWLGLPSDICKKYLPESLPKIELEDEKGHVYLTVYIGRRSGLSGGWKAFAQTKRLAQGDALVFELAKPDRFKIHIFKALVMSSEEEHNKQDIIASAEMMISNPSVNEKSTKVEAVKEKKSTNTVVVKEKKGKLFRKKPFRPTNLQ